ncbi:MAG: citrate synthase [Proteobacteria bacterium]|nr:citrate synthase [Pseudomonadota bacterium]MBU1640033.1 citrate synthase [Pseudomonadota bacterium]
MVVQKQKVVKRDEAFAHQTKTKIWQEIPSEQNPYLTEQCRCHGYDILELAQKRSFMDVLFLLFQGELPNPEQAELLEMLFIALINPGPRHPACRASMNAAVSRTNTAHLLPIGLSVLSGTHLGAQEVTTSMRFLAENLGHDPVVMAQEALASEYPDEGGLHPIPGFGNRFGGIDLQPLKIATILMGHAGAGAGLAWGSKLAETLELHQMGWLTTGLAAATFTDLGFSPWAGGGLFQLMNAPGILAHGLELADKPINDMPFLDKDHYVIAPEAQKN